MPYELDLFSPNRCKHQFVEVKVPSRVRGWQIAVFSKPIIEKGIEMELTNRRLMWHGMFLFLIGLLTGFAEQHFANTRMALAAHLEGVMNGTFLLALGAVWNEVRLSSRTKVVAYWVALCGTYGNWLITMLAAAFGTAALSPINGAGHRGLPWQETLVTFGFLSIAITIIATALFALWGLRAKALP